MLAAARYRDFDAHKPQPKNPAPRYIFINLSKIEPEEVVCPSKSELAAAYGIKRRTLHKWLQIKALQEELAKTGYNKHANRFTPKQLQIIFDYLGLPECLL